MTETPYTDMHLERERHQMEFDAGGNIKWPPHMQEMGLFPYQVEGFHWLFVHTKSILGDEMGLGKTIIIGRLLHYITFGGTAVSNVLILGPSILGFNWQDELREKFGLNVTVATGLSDADMNALKGAPIVYTNYDKLNLARFNNIIQKRPWGTIIVDEAHKVKGHKARRSTELVRVAQRATRVHFLTGSPYPQGSPADVFVPLSTFDKDIRDAGFWKYVGEWCIQSRVETEGGSWREIGPAKQPKVFSGMMTQYMLRRTRQEVGRQLPPVLRKVIRHSLSPRQKSLYRSMTKALSFVTKAGVRVEAQNSAVQWEFLRRVCLSARLFDATEEIGAKVEAIGEVVEQAFLAKRKVVIFTWHRDLAFMLARAIEAAYDFEPYTIVGGIRPEDQYTAAHDFNTRDGFTVLIGTIAAMGTGLNLQSASVAIFAEISYVPTENDQALARLHREGQQNTINTYYFVANGTIEHYIYEQVIVKGQNITHLLDAHRRAQEIQKAKV